MPFRARASVLHKIASLFGRLSSKFCIDGIQCKQGVIVKDLLKKVIHLIVNLGRTIPSSGDSFKPALAKERGMIDLAVWHLTPQVSVTLI